MKVRTDLFALLVMYGVLSLMPIFFYDNRAILNLLIMSLILGVVAAGWDLVMGFGGIFSFAQVAFYVVGAYSSAIIANQFGISPWLGLFAGGGIAAGVSLLIALPSLRLKGSYIALLTFAFHMLLLPLFKSDVGRYIGTGGMRGIIGIPPFSVGAYTFSLVELVPPFYATLGISFAALFTIYKMIHSKWGLAFVAFRDSEPFAHACGVDVFRSKLLLFGVSSFLIGMIGAYYGHYIGMLSPRLLDLDLFLNLMVMQVIGGMGAFPGAMIGSFIVTFASDYLYVVEVFRLVIFGAIVVALCVTMPGGIMGIISSRLGEGILVPVPRFIRQTFTRQLGRKRIEK